MTPLAQRQGSCSTVGTLPHVQQTTDVVVIGTYAVAVQRPAQRHYPDTAWVGTFRPVRCVDLIF